MTAVPSSSGWASAAEGQIQCKPASASGKVEKKGDATASGCTADPKSCTKPGRVSAADRVAPPATELASRTSTEKPARARTMAAAKPFGPAPTIVAVGGTDLSVMTPSDNTVTLRSRKNGNPFLKTV